MKSSLSNGILKMHSCIAALLAGERHWEGKVSCLRMWHSDPRLGSIVDQMSFEYNCLTTGPSTPNSHWGPFSHYSLPTLAKTSLWMVHDFGNTLKSFLRLHLHLLIDNTFASSQYKLNKLQYEKYKNRKTYTEIICEAFWFNTSTAGYLSSKI